MAAASPRVIFHTATTLNGFLADDEDSLDWLFAVPGADEAEGGFAGFLEGVGAIVMGSATYEWVLAHEKLLERPEVWHTYYGDRPTFVLTTRRLAMPAGCDIRLRAGAVDALWPELSAAAGDRDLWVTGGGDVAGQFADADRLDQIRVSIAPVTLPQGKPLLPRLIGSDRLTLESAVQAGQFAELVYSVAPAGSS